MELKCGSCKKSISKKKGDRVIVDAMDENGIDIEVYCTSCGTTNCISFEAPYMLTWREGR